MAPPARSALFPLFSGGPGDPPRRRSPLAGGWAPPPALIAGLIPILAAVLVLGAAAGCSRATSADDAESVDPYSVAASRAAAAGETGTDAATDGSADASADASATPSLSPQDEELRRTALSTAAPVRPPGMDDNTPQGAVASAQYFMSLYPYVYVTGDLTDWRAMSNDTCTFCNNVIDNVTELHSNGGWEDPWIQTITSATHYTGVSGPNVAEDAVGVELFIDSEESTTHNGPDGTVEVRPAESGQRLILALEYRDGTWIVDGGSTQ